MIEGAEAARAALDAGRPALLWRRQLADTETPVAAALKLIEPGRGDSCSNRSRADRCAGATA
ncbi:MAG: hypothetical protein WDN44_10450 [Sphingomonas sp.]